METDHFALWIEIRTQLNKFDDDQLYANSHIVRYMVNILGGWKNLLLFLLKDKQSFTFKQLYELRGSILYESTPNTYANNTNKCSLLSVNDDCINEIYKFLPQKDHISLSKTCSHFLTIGRSASSFPSPKAAYKMRIVPGLSYCLINYSDNGDMDDFIKYINFDTTDKTSYDLFPIAELPIFQDLIELSQIKNKNIDITNTSYHDIERKKYFVFAVMKSILDNRYSPSQPKMLEVFDVKNIAENYCKSYIANNPPKIESNKVSELLHSLTHEYDDMDDETKNDDDNIMDPSYLNNPYYKNAQIACCIYKKLRSWHDNEDLVEELDKCIYALETHHRRHSSTPVIDLGFEDPDVLLHFEKLKVKDLESELERVLMEIEESNKENESIKQLINVTKQERDDAKEKLRKISDELNYERIRVVGMEEFCENIKQRKLESTQMFAAEIDRYSKIINGLLEIPQISDIVKICINDVRPSMRVP